MSTPDCTDVCEIIIDQLKALGFNVSQDEDHTSMIEQLALCKLVREPGPGEREWPLWNLTEETVKAIAKKKGLSLAGKNLDEIARQAMKGMAWAVDDVWEEVIENAINNTEPDWKFSIADRSLSDSSENRGGNSYELTETWTGELDCVSGDDKFLIAFELVHHVTEDNGSDTAKITSGKPDKFNEEEWDDLVDQMTGFIEAAYKKEPWKEVN